MRRWISCCVVSLILSAQVFPRGANGATFDAGLAAGTQGGPGGTAQVLVSGFAADFPWSARLGVTFSTRDPGNPQEARRIFINDATNGIPREKGRLWTWSLDLLHPIWEGRNGSVIYAFGGPRYGAFTGNFAFIGGNEDFDIRERTWGIGGGLEDHLPLGERTRLLLQAGVDYYREASLQGHDTVYTPDDENVNARRDYDYADADGAVSQPKLEARVMAGILVRLGD